MAVRLSVGGLARVLPRKLLIAAGLDALAIVAAAPVAADTAGAPVDRQAYVSDLTNGADPYNGDQANIHVSVEAGQPATHALVHIDLSALQGGGSVSSLTLKLSPDSSSTDNVNSGSAAMQACPLTQPIPDQPTSTDPKYDCSQLKSVGKLAQDNTWTFDLTSLASRWAEDGDYGAAIVPAPPATGTSPLPVDSSTWAVGFERAKSTASLEYSSAAPAEPAYQPPPEPALGVIPAPAALPAPVVAPSPVATSPPSTQAAAPPALVTTTTTLRQSRAWMAVTLALALVALGLVAGGAIGRSAAHGFHPLAALSALSLARSRASAPIAVLLAGALIAAGSVAQLAVSKSVQAAGGQSGRVGQLGGPAGTSLAGSAPGTTAAGATAGTLAGVGSTGGTGASTESYNGYHPGVTDTTVKVGFLSAANLAAFQKASGVNQVGFGDAQAEADALTKWVNAHGGIAGRKMDDVVKYDDSTNPDPNQPNTICQQLTADTPVFAVIDVLGINTFDTNACYFQAHTLVFDQYTRPGDSAYDRQNSPYYWTVSSPSQDLGVKTEVAGLSQEGFFPALSHLGVVVQGEPSMERAYSGTFVKAVKAAGYSGSIDVYTTDSTQTVQTQMQNAILQFRQHGVDHVTFIVESGVMFYFMLEAQNQQWFPKYGFSSNDAPTPVRDATSPDQVQQQLANSVGVGWDEGTDVEDAQGDPYPYGPAEKLCDSIFRSAGVEFSPDTRFAHYGAFGYCDAVMTLWAAGLRVQVPLTVQAFAQAAESLGESQPMARLMLPADLGPDRHFGAAAYRLVGWNSSCSCFVYTSGNLRMPG